MTEDGVEVVDAELVDDDHLPAINAAMSAVRTAMPEDMKPGTKQAGGLRHA